MLGRFFGTVAIGFACLRGRGAGAIARLSVDTGSAAGAATGLAFLRGGGGLTTVEGHHWGASFFATPRAARLAFWATIGVESMAGAAVRGTSGEGRSIA